MMKKRMRGLLLLLLALVTAGGLTGCSRPEAEQGPVVGIAWVDDTESEFYTNVVLAVEQAGGTAVLLDQVSADYLPYDGEGRLVDCCDEVGALTPWAAELVKENTWTDTNAEQVVQGVDAVIFTGGSDVSSSLYAQPQPWHGIEAEIDYNAVRDVSDYILMAYCVDQDIATVGFCRGMQMLAVVCGAQMIQDIPAHFDALGLEYGFEHRNEKASPDAYRDYVPHDVVLAEDSLARDVFGTGRLTGCPSWHHQAVLSIDGTHLLASGTADTNGVEMIEILEYPGREFIIGLQFHPEAALEKQSGGAQNAPDFMDREAALMVFEGLLAAAN